VVVRKSMGFQSRAGGRVLPFSMARTTGGERRAACDQDFIISSIQPIINQIPNWITL
jgi:hypothetical protein